MQEEEDWESIEIPDFIKILEERKIAEQKLVEEDDNRLTNELFNPIETPTMITVKMPETVKRPKKPTPFIKNGETNSLAKAKAIKERKEIIKRRKEIFGEAELDKYEEQYGHIADI
jgi:hypothetical protein